MRMTCDAPLPGPVSSIRTEFFLSLSALSPPLQQPFFQPQLQLPSSTAPTLPQLRVLPFLPLLHVGVSPPPIIFAVRLQQLLVLVLASPLLLISIFLLQQQSWQLPPQLHDASVLLQLLPLVLVSLPPLQP